MFGRPLPPLCPIFLQLYCDTSALYFLPILSNAILWFLPGLTAVHFFLSFKTLSSNVFFIIQIWFKILIPNSEVMAGRNSFESTQMQLPKRPTCRFQVHCTQYRLHLHLYIFSSNLTKRWRSLNRRKYIFNFQLFMFSSNLHFVAQQSDLSRAVRALSITGREGKSMLA